MMTAPLSMRSSGSPGSWPPPGVYLRHLASTYTRSQKLANFFRNSGTNLCRASWTFLTVHAGVVCVPHDPAVRLRDVAASLDSPNTAFGIRLVLVVAGLIAADRSFKIVQQYEQGIIFRFGRVLPRALS
jgi:hypothetical protein